MSRRRRTSPAAEPRTVELAELSHYITPVQTAIGYVRRRAEEQRRRLESAGAEATDGLAEDLEGLVRILHGGGGDDAATDDGWITVAHAAAILGVSDATVRRWHKAGKGPPLVMRSGQWFARRCAVVAWAEARNPECT